ncbi:MAG: DnaT-like ssDNA-binding domain-containing protein [Haliea sp.]
MEMAWIPSTNARLTLKQLGLSQAQITQAVDHYAGRGGEKTDREFMRFARNKLTSLSLEYQIQQTASIPVSWQPEQGTSHQLRSSGYQPEAIAHYRDLFVVNAREQGRALRYPDAAFLAFCQHRPAALQAPMPRDWIPRPSTVQQLVEEGQHSSEWITDQIEIFIHHYQHKCSANWDRTFQAWIADRAG